MVLVDWSRAHLLKAEINNLVSRIEDLEEKDEKSRKHKKTVHKTFLVDRDNMKKKVHGLTIFELGKKRELRNTYRELAKRVSRYETYIAGLEQRLNNQLKEQKMAKLMAEQMEKSIIKE